MLGWGISCGRGSYESHHGRTNKATIKVDITTDKVSADNFNAVLCAERRGTCQRR